MLLTVSHNRNYQPPHILSSVTFRFVPPALTSFMRHNAAVCTTITGADRSPCLLVHSPVEKVKTPLLPWRGERYTATRWPSRPQPCGRLSPGSEDSQWHTWDAQLLYLNKREGCKSCRSLKKGSERATNPSVVLSRGFNISPKVGKVQSVVLESWTVYTNNTFVCIHKHRRRRRK